MAEELMKLTIYHMNHKLVDYHPPSSQHFRTDMVY